MRPTTIRRPKSRYRCPFGLSGQDEGRVAARYAERLLDDPSGGVVEPAAMVVEAVQGEGGVIPAPDSWMREMRRITAERGVALIVDEVQTGVGRTGAMWAVQHSGITPDVMVLSKAIGGSLPLAVVVYPAGPGGPATSVQETAPTSGRREAVSESRRCSGFLEKSHQGGTHAATGQGAVRGSGPACRSA